SDLPCHHTEPNPWLQHAGHAAKSLARAEPHDSTAIGPDRGDYNHAMTPYRHTPSTPPGAPRALPPQGCEESRNTGSKTMPPWCRFGLPPTQQAALVQVAGRLREGDRPAQPVRHSPGHLCRRVSCGSPRVCAAIICVHPDDLGFASEELRGLSACDDSAC